MENKKRPIKSFVLRQGRLTAKQKSGLDELWDKYCINLQQGECINFSNIFPCNNPLVVEIGFGMGDSLLKAAIDDPHRNYLGIEVHRPGVGSLLNAIDEASLTNLKIVSHDAVEVLRNHIADNIIQECWVLFPDPWHKTKHHKRRLINSDFLTLAAKKIRTNGVIHIATDWDDYAKRCMNLLSDHPDFVNTEKDKEFSHFNEFRGETKFERRGVRLGHCIRDLRFTCCRSH
jgi:tRNA (guanine-N7-)-methyltransferase